MIRPAQALFAVLVVATLAAFLVTQRLKQTPRLVQTLSVTEVYSPKIKYRKAGIRMRLKRTDDATVSLLNENGDVVRRLVRNRHYQAGKPIQLLWDGRDEHGAIVPDGAYRVRVGLRRQGRSVTLVDEVRIDATPPRPVVEVQRPEGATGPLIFPLPAGAPVRFKVSNATVVGTPVFRVYRTDLRRPRAVTRLHAGPGATEGEWRGPVAGARRPPQGTYVIVAQVTDRAGNVGSSYPFGDRGARAPRGHAGVTVRYLAGQAPTRAVRAGSRLTVFVDARRAPYRWRLHRLGQTRTVARGRGRRPVLRLRVPGREPSGVYLLELRARGRRAKVPVYVTGAGHQKVLLVLPLVTWQGLNPVDDEGDGLPNTLSSGGPVRVARPFAGRGEPPGFARTDSPFLRFLDRPRQRYDLETDYRLAGRPASYLDRYGGVVIAGDERWIEPGLAARLRAYVERGGKVLSLGTKSLRREVEARRGLLVRPTGASAYDVFGARIAPRNPGSVDLLASEDAIGLFEGGDGAFTGFSGYEVTTSPGSGARIVSSAQTSDGRPVIVAIRSGKGLVVRTGLADWTRRLSNPNVSTLTRRTWQIFSQ